MIRTPTFAALTVVLGLALAGAAAPAAPPRTAAPKVKDVTLLIRHRVFQSFSEVDTVSMRSDFEIGDTPYSARVVEFVPDFAMNLKTRRIFSRSNQPNNPAFRIVVKEKGVPSDTTWAFLDMPPHFARKSMLAFLVRRITFEDHAPIATRDSSATAGGAR